MVAASAANGFNIAALFKTIRAAMSLARYFVWVGTWADVQKVCSIAARVVCFALPVLWRTLFLCLDVEDSVPHTPCKPSSARLDPAL